MTLTGPDVGERLLTSDRRKIVYTHTGVQMSVRWHRVWFTGTATALVLALLGALTISPAQAYNVTVYQATILISTTESENCLLIHKESDEAFAFNVTPVLNGCAVSAVDMSYTATHFNYDTGGMAALTVLYIRTPVRTTIATVAFHPYDELLVVADTRNDSDTIYVELESEGACQICPPNAPPVTSSVIDSETFDLDLPEGDGANYAVWDNPDGSHLLAASVGVA